MIYNSKFITHPSHEHKLKQVTDPVRYKCDGCKEFGFGLRYRCDDCDYDLHKECCALPPASISHHFFRDSHFEFLEKGKPERFCDACGKDVLGFVYHCRKNGYDLHPCCANLPVHVFQRDGVTLKLHNDLSSECDECGLKRLWGKVKGWSYRATNGEYQVHVSCVKAMVEKLAEEKAECCSVEDVQKMNILSTYDGNSKVSKSLELIIKPQDGAIASTSSSSKGKRIRKCWKMVKTMLALIVSLIIGDPTALLATVIVNSISSK